MPAIGYPETNVIVDLTVLGAVDFARVSSP